MSRNERITWTNKAIETFLDLCLETKNSGCSKYDWDTITLRLNAQMGKNFEKKAVENLFSDCKSKFKAWYELKTKWTGIGWNELHKGRPSAFLKRPLPFEQEMHNLFAGSFATGNMAWANNSSGLSLFDKGKMVEAEEELAEFDNGELTSDKKYDNEDEDAGSKSLVKILYGKKRKSSDVGQASSKRSVTEDLETCMDGLRKNIQLGSSIAQSSPSSSLYERLISTLQDITEVKEHGKTFILDCLDFLLQPEKNGELWLALPDNEYRLIYLRKKVRFPDDFYRPQFDDVNDDAGYNI
ncbi:Isoleucine--tRNA ligase [Bienertia sinuspersici]